MADPFSIVSVVVIALKTIHTTKNYVETICRAPRSVSALAVDLADIESLLRQLGQIAQDERADDSEMHQILSRPIATCETAVNELHKLIDPYVRISGGLKVWGRFSFGFKESEVQLMSTKLGNCKQNLTLATTSANLLASRKTGRGVKRIQHHLGIETSSVASEDIHGRTFEHIERWNLETQTIVEEDTELSASIPQQVPSSFAPPETPQNHSTNYNIARPLTGSSVSSIDYIPPAPLQDYSKKHSAPTPPVIPPKEEALAATDAKQGLRFFSTKHWVTPLSPKKTESKR